MTIYTSYAKIIGVRKDKAIYYNKELYGYSTKTTAKHFNKMLSQCSGLKRVGKVFRGLVSKEGEYCEVEI